MIFSIKADKSVDEQIYQVVVIAPNKKRALELAQHEFSVMDFMYEEPEYRQKLIATKIDCSKEQVVSVV